MQLNSWSLMQSGACATLPLDGAVALGIAGWAGGRTAGLERKILQVRVPARHTVGAEHARFPLFC
jgi:hypothetical protein